MGGEGGGKAAQRRQNEAGKKVTPIITGTQLHFTKEILFKLSYTWFYRHVVRFHMVITNKICAAVEHYAHDFYFWIV